MIDLSILSFCFSVISCKIASAILQQEIKNPINKTHKNKNTLHKTIRS